MWQALGPDVTYMELVPVRVTTAAFVYGKVVLEWVAPMVRLVHPDTGAVFEQGQAEAAEIDPNATPREWRFRVGGVWWEAVKVRGCRSCGGVPEPVPVALAAHQSVPALATAPDRVVAPPPAPASAPLPPAPPGV